MNTEIENKSLAILKIIESWKKKYDFIIEHNNNKYSFDSFFDKEDIKCINEYAESPLPIFESMYKNSLSNFHDKLYLLMFNEAHIYCDGNKTELSYGFAAKNDPFIIMKSYLHIRNLNKKRKSMLEKKINKEDPDKIDMFGDMVESIKKMSQEEKIKFQENIDATKNVLENTSIKKKNNETTQKKGSENLEKSKKHIDNIRKILKSKNKNPDNTPPKGGKSKKP